MTNVQKNMYALGIYLEGIALIKAIPHASVNDNNNTTNHSNLRYNEYVTAQTLCLEHGKAYGQMALSLVTLIYVNDCNF